MALDGSTASFIPYTLNGLQDIALDSSTVTTIQVNSLTPNRVVVSDGSNYLVSAGATTTEVDYLSGTTSNVQTQLNSKASLTYVDTNFLNKTTSTQQNVQAFCDFKSDLTTDNVYARSTYYIPKTTFSTHGWSITRQLNGSVLKDLLFRELENNVDCLLLSENGQTVYVSLKCDYATASKIPIFDANKKLVSSGVDALKITYLDNVSSDIQTQLNGKLNLSGNNANQDINIGAYKVQSTATPIVASDLTNKDYVDTAITAGLLLIPRRADVRTGVAPSIQPSETMSWYFGTHSNNNVTPYSDILLPNGWVDSSGGKVNMISFSKGTAGGIRQYQGTHGSTSNFTDYYDCVMTDLNSSNVTLSGNLAMGANKITTSYTPVNADDLTRKGYVDTQDGLRLLKAGDTATGTIFNSAGDFHPYKGGDTNKGCILFANNADGASYATYNGGLASWHGIGLKSTFDSTTRFIFDTRTGDYSQTGTMKANAVNIDGQTASRVCVFDASKNVTSSSVTTTTLGFLDATSSIQGQLNAKANLAGGNTFTGTQTYSDQTASTVAVFNGSKNLVSSSVTTTTLGFLDATSSIQGQLNTLSGTFANYLPLAGGTITGNLVVNGANGIGLGSTSVTSGYLGPRYYLSSRGDNQDDLVADEKYGPWFGLGASGVPGFTGVPCLAGYSGLALRTASGFLVMNDLGNVGIGITPSTARMNIANPGSMDFMSLQNTSYVFGNFINQRFLFGTSAGTNRSAYIQSALSTGNKTNFLFYTDAGAGIVSEKFRITGDGNIGIGTDPSTKLHIYNDGAFQTRFQTSGVDSHFINSFYEGFTLNANFSLTTIPNTGRGSSQIILQTPAGAGGNIQFMTGNAVNTAPTERMRITADGNVGIGRTDPNSKLDIQKEARSGTHGTGCAIYATRDAGEVSDGIAEFRHSNGTQGIGIGFGGIYATGTNANQDLQISARGTGTVRINNPMNCYGVVNVRSTAYAVPNGLSTLPGQLVIGGIDRNYVGDWSAGLLAECQDRWEFSVHDSGSRLTSFLYYDNNTITIGRDAGTYGVTPTIIASSLTVNSSISTPARIAITNSDPGDLISKRYGSGDRYGIGQYAGGITRVFTSNTYAPSEIRFSLATDDVTTGAAGFTDLMTITHGGNVGIKTSAPLGDLHVQLAGAVNDYWGKLVVKTTSFWGDGCSVRSETAGTQYATMFPMMLLTPHVVSDSDGWCYIRMGRSGGVSTGRWWEMAVRADGKFQIGVERSNQFVIDTLGKVGIGVTNPSGVLDIYNTTSDYTNNVVIRTPWAGVVFDNTQVSGGRQWGLFSGGSGAGIGTGSLGIYDITAGAYRFNILSDGRTMIGGNTGYAKFGISGGNITGNVYTPAAWPANANGMLITEGQPNANSSALYVGHQNDGGFITSLQPSVAWNDILISAAVTQIYAFGVLVAYSDPTGWINISDEREKEDIQPLKTDKSLQRILSLRPTNYRRRFTEDDTPIPKEHKEKRLVGFVAQEVLQSNPHCVSRWCKKSKVQKKQKQSDIFPPSQNREQKVDIEEVEEEEVEEEEVEEEEVEEEEVEEEEEERLGLNYNDYIVHLVGAVQEQQKQIEASRREMEILTKRNQILEDHARKLEADFADYKDQTDRRMTQLAELVKGLLEEPKLKRTKTIVRE